MSNSEKSGLKARPSVLALALAAVSVGAVFTPAMAQDPEPAEDAIVVTGFRASLAGALEIKRNESGIVDAILAEDIADFPDSNLAESIQRIPGVTLTRSDGGEGRQLTVRGLNSSFTRVRINGIEGTTATGASDILGSTNRGRGFDFSVFASELFSSVQVRKTSSPDVEEGSLGATVDLTTGRPFDFDGFTFAMGAQAVRNELEGGTHPRVTALISDTWADNRFGALLSVAWSRRTLQEEGYEAVDILPASVDGGFCTPIGFTPQNPANDAIDGTTPTACATGLPRTSVLAEYNDVFSRTDNFGGTVATPAAGSGAFHPRLPRYRRSVTEYERLGVTGALQWRPTDHTDINFDVLWGEFSNTRHDNYILTLSTGRNLGVGGKPFMSIRDVEFEADGSWKYGLFDGADIRSEGLRDVYTTYFSQYALSGTHAFSDRFSLDAMYGVVRSDLNAPTRTTINIDSPNRSGYSFDFRQNNNVPVLAFGFDVANPANFVWTNAALADGTLQGAFNGRYLSTKTQLETAEINATFDLTDNLTFRAGASRRSNVWDNYEISFGGNGIALATPLSQLTRPINDFGDGLDAGAGVPTAWAAADLDKFLGVVNLHCNCAAVPGSVYDTLNQTIRIIDEDINAYYGMASFNFDLASILVRGDLGVRYAETNLSATGVASVGTSRTLVTIENTYEDTLPSLNIAAELTDDIFLRFSAAKVMSRPEYMPLAPTTGININAQQVTIGNPNLEPIRADTWDIQAEWYFAEGSLLSIGFFHKEIETFIQGFGERVLFNTLGLPDSLLTGGTATPCVLVPTPGSSLCNTLPTTEVTVSRQVNTDGGPLDGFEINLQAPFTFLPGFWGNFGLLANYTHVESEIEYVTRLDNLATPANERLTVTGEFVGLSPDSYNTTLFYEDDRFSARISSAYKSRAINNVLGNLAGHDFIFTDPATYYDASASYNVNDRLRLTFEGQNLTDQEVRFGQDTERNDTRLWVHSGRTLVFGLSYRY